MFRLRTFGGAALFADGRALQGAVAQRRRVALLTLLAVAGDAGMSRDKLIAFLWPESGSESARHTLSQWLHLLRRDLGASDVISGAADLRLNPERVTSDVVDLQRAIAAGDLESAVALYEGPFLDGFHLSGSPEFERWVDGERDRFAHLWRRAAEALAARRAASGDRAGAAEIWRKIAATDPCDSRVAVQLMRALADAGDVAGALNHARVHAALVRAELGDEPEPEVALLAERLARAAPPAIPPSPAAPPAAPFPEVAPPADASRAQASRRRSRVRRTLRIAAVAVGLAMALASGALAFVPPQMRATMFTIVSRGREHLDPHRIVVAPFENRTGDSSLAVFGEMAADWTAQSLVRTGELEVVDARSAVLTSRIVDLLPPFLRASDRAVALAEELGAGQVVAGRFYRDGDSLRVQARVLETGTGRVLRVVGPLSGPLRSPAALVEALGHSVAALAAATVDTSFAGAGIVESSPPSFEAYRETSRAWEAYYRSDYPAIFSHVARAVAADSQYMLPLVILGHVYGEQRRFREVDSVARIIAAHRARLTPLELAGLDLLEATAAGDADATYLGAVEVAHAAPGSAETRTHAAHLAVEANRPRAALALLKDVDPKRGLMLVVPWYWSRKAAALHELGDYEAQLAATDAGLRQFPDNGALLMHRGKALAALGRVGELRALAEHASPRMPASAVHFGTLQRYVMMLEWARELDGHGHAEDSRRLRDCALGDLARLPLDTASRTLRMYGMGLEDAGRWGEARRIFATLSSRDSRNPTDQGHLGVIAAHLGERGEAARIEQTLEKTDGRWLHGVHTMWRARIAAALGNRDQALMLATLAVEQGYTRGYDLYGPSFGEYDLHTDPSFAPLRGTPGFDRLLTPRG